MATASPDPLPPAHATTASPPALPSAPPPVLTQEHLRQLEAAQVAAGRVRRAAAIARADGWTLAVFAALTFLLGLGSPSAAALAAGMGVVAFIELRSGDRLRRLDPAAARVLGFNQLVLAAILIIYGAWGIHTSLTGPGPYASYAAADPQLARALRPVEGITRTITIAVYCGIIATALAAQGGLAVYYFTRRRHVCAYLADTPAWVREVRTAAVGTR